MKRISKLVSLVLVVISMCLLLSCQSGGKKVVKLTSENWQDYLNVKVGKITTTHYSGGRFNEEYKGQSISPGDWFNIESRNSDYLFEDVEGIIICTFDVRGDKDRCSETLKFILDRGGTGSSQYISEVHPTFYIDGEEIRLNDFNVSEIINNLQLDRIEFKSGTVRKNELAD